ncbi:glutamine amidotransferase-related protein [Gracilimonas mengyeensis]|uniref:GMP synthase-Glutamine amidotransferase n=1 Tax=Gracilimonas mengyeensis TaxID=1302730 RepID=A0A521D3D4_9BACT|nr:gamma-glutamyl-gamma-aminobutyrate hydrolase family protein [Gracilimonas mengyeensis]SMO66162.1 GMP synthase-Glutamine amidotransferase [Gracilimonas mengyeensis]
MHVPFEGPGMIETYLEEKGFMLQKINLYDDHSLPVVDDVDYLIVMGGPMNIEDEEKYPWLTGEKELIKKMIGLGKPVLGICFGAQLIAHVMGKSVHPAKDHEIGWYPINLTETGKTHPATKHWEDPMVYHWHSNTFDLPEGAVHLASTELCTNQAFVVNENIIGLQFHLEIGRPEVQAMINNWGRYRESGDHVQSAEQMLLKSEEASKRGEVLLYNLLYYWTK